MSIPTPFLTKLVSLGLGGIFAGVLLAAGKVVEVFLVCSFVLTGGGRVGVRTVTILAVGAAVVVVAVVTAIEAVTDGAGLVAVLVF